MTAPIVLFVYGRPDHTKRTLDALSVNRLANQSELIVFSDGPRTDSDVKSVTAVRDVVKLVKGFRRVELIERQENYGLAKNIIEGVTDVCRASDSVIVLEDDLITSPLFLSFMNAALEKYRNENQVWHISGWNYPIDVDGLGDAFLMRLMNCWGWGTWADRWKFFEKNTDQIIGKFDQAMIRSFDLDNSGVFWSQIVANKRQEINTWAIYWYATIFMNKGLCLNPAYSYVENIGHDGSGTHRSNAGKIFSTKLSQSMVSHFPEAIEENGLAVLRIKDYYKKIKPSIPCRVLAKIKNSLQFGRV